MYRKALLFILAIFISFIVNAQDKNLTFRISEKGNADNLEAYINALKKANLDKYRLEHDVRILTFDTGVKVEILSAEELRTKNIPFNESLVVTEIVPLEYDAVFKLNEDGFILEQHSCVNNKIK